MKRLIDKREYVTGTILFAVYLAFNGILFAGHELWRDEANVWLIARDMGPLQLFGEIKYQGHPCLWYLIAMPFAKLGFPFRTLSVLSFLVMSIAAGLFAYKSPCHPMTKAICLMSPMFTYYYPVVARNYCLIALLLLLVAYFYPKRNEKSMLYGLLLGLLVQADTIALAAAGLISCMWLWECVMHGLKAKSMKPVWRGGMGLGIPLFSLGLWGLQFYQVSDSPEYAVRSLGVGELVTEIKNFSYHILTRMTGLGQDFDLFVIVIFLASGILFAVAIKNIWPVIVMMGSFLFQVLFSVLVYQLHIWHYIALCFVLIWCFWICHSMKEETEMDKVRRKSFLGGKLLAESLLVIMGIAMFCRWNTPEESSNLQNAWKGVYSDGVNTAEYIKNYVGKEALIISTDVIEASTVQAYLGRQYRFYYAGTGKQETYANYTVEQSVSVSYEALITWIKKEFPEKQEFYLLISPTNHVEDIPDDAKSRWEVCYETTGETARGEEYLLVKIGLRE